MTDHSRSANSMSGRCEFCGGMYRRLDEHTVCPVKAAIDNAVEPLKRQIVDLQNRVESLEHAGKPGSVTP